MRIVFLNPQGNFDPQDRYWTEHPDFGGQLVYVKEVAQALARKGIKVDIITRRIIDPEWSGFEGDIDFYPGVENLRIIRIPFGGDRFLRKEDLWPYMGEFVDGILRFYEKENTSVDIFTGHYADGGLAGALLQERTGIPFTFTGHSLGAQKMDKLGFNHKNCCELEQKYHFTDRITAERISMKYSAVNIVSTLQERYQQYDHPLYNEAIDVKDDSRFMVIPPGVNTRIFYSDVAENLESKISGKVEGAKRRDLYEDRWNLPLVIASSRLDPKKNHAGLIRAFADSEELQQKCNLCIVVRGLLNPFKECNKLDGVEGKVLKELLQIIENNGLQGKVCFLDLRSQREIADCYRYLSKKGGIFILTALYEPFGLAPLEAAACGLPVVVTKNGGPDESFKDDKREYGVLINPDSSLDIARGLLRLLNNNEEWQKIKEAGIERVKSRYTWEQTANGYFGVVENILSLNREKIKIFMPSLNIEQLLKLYVKECN